MAATHGFQASLQALHDKLPYLSKTHAASLSDATEILDTDFDSDSYDDYSDDSQGRSMGSLATESVTTVSTPDDIKTPDTTGLTGFHFHIDESPIKGPTGPHLFRHSDDSFDTKDPLGVDLMVEDAPVNIDTPVPEKAPRQRKKHSPPKTLKFDSMVSAISERNVSSWSPQDVVMWMRNLGFEDAIVEKFFINDITGAILLELHVEDLKELDIQSFGKRHRLMGAIRELKNSTPVPSCDAQPALDPTSREDTTTPKTTAAEVGVSECTSPVPEKKSESRSRSSSNRRRRRHRRHQGIDVVPEDSVSIVAIEQILPQLHTCSKGENCRKWQKQQVKLARLARDLPIDSLGGSIIITGDPGNAATAQSIAKTPKSDVTPSLIASSDALGQNDSPQAHLSQDSLSDVQSRDPQENVRNFLRFQRLSKLQPVTDPATPPKENFPSPNSNSPESGKPNPTLSENLRHLPKLRIPSSHGNSTLSPNYSAQRTITPSFYQRRPSFERQSTQKSPRSSDYYAPSPSDFYRQDPHYGQYTPVSEMDVPTTAIPLGPVARAFSQSVPPDMRFGGHHIYHIPDPIARPTSTKAENHKRKGSNLSLQPVPSLGRLDESSPLPPIDTPEDMDRTPRAGHCRNDPFSPGSKYANDVIHSGWMKKRKTTRLLRHEWADHHFTLRGTRLAMHADEESSRRDSKALEHIDVDDYAVACSSLPSNSKLTAAFKKTVLKRKDNEQGDAAFAFSLIPSPNRATFDRKSIFVNGPKSHHFAVKSRDERIDWMRELMLAKALRKGRESGATINVNGAAF